MRSQVISRSLSEKFQTKEIDNVHTNHFVFLVFVADVLNLFHYHTKSKFTSKLSQTKIRMHTCNHDSVVVDITSTAHLHVDYRYVVRDRFLVHRLLLLL